MKKLAFAFAASLLLLTAHPSYSADSASADDTARILAGLAPSAESPLAPVAQDKAWQAHAANLNAAFAKTDAQQLSKIRDWRAENLKTHRQTMFYFFSGPDFLYANAFFPNAKTYVMAGLEPAGEIPDLMKWPRGSIPGQLAPLRTSMNTLLAVSFFITKNMQTELHSGRLRGTLPVLYVFLARSGKTIRDVNLVYLDDEGVVHSGDGVKEKSRARGVKIVFASGLDAPEQTLYYFSTDLSNDGFKKGGFDKFCAKLGDGDSFVKSASYLMHNSGFAQVREFLIEHSAVLLQDDSGVPVVHLDPKKWQLHPFGRYLGPLGLFPGTNQPKLAELYKKSAPIQFGVGYRWRPTETNLLLAIKNPPEPAKPAEAPKQ